MKQMSQNKVNYTLLSAGVLGVAALRTVMSPYPNIEPVMLFTLATGLALGPLAGFIMGAGSMIASNFLMVGGPLTFPWIFLMPLVTIYTSLAYGGVGIIAGLLGRVEKKWGRINLAAAATGLTILYDLATCICFALQFFGPAGIPAAMVAQVPFTLLHLSNVVLAFVFGPYVLKLAQKTRNLSIKQMIDHLKTPTT